jgi:H+/Cl- antiporter ClcA
LGLNPGFAAALGLVGLFCCAANSPIGAIFLGTELFGLSALPYYVLICLLLWPLSAPYGLFKNRLFQPIFHI